ncbi:hypothetical protein L2E82_45634 [Cichorium intybus]|uniref:Uncharacterized protein n=1 Tax=Cichorium intybus TaxID=13427 RepID=A0ACB8ZTM1_CICIN|nr:hypothetical protein L2E82_45634 [Cichorium intybus]
MFRRCPSTQPPSTAGTLEAFQSIFSAISLKDSSSYFSIIVSLLLFNPSLDHLPWLKRRTKHFPPQLLEKAEKPLLV